MKKDSTIFLGHILESISLIETYLDGKTQDDFLNAIELQDKVLYRLMIIGEASNNLSEEIKNHYSDIPWRDIIGLRNVVAHEYFGVSLDEVWDTTQKDVPIFKKQVEGILSEISKKLS